MEVEEIDLLAADEVRELRHRREVAAPPLAEEKDARAGVRHPVDHVAAARYRADEILEAAAVAAEDLRLDDALGAAAVERVDDVQDPVSHGVSPSPLLE